jgi:hypothetical protein
MGGKVFMRSVAEGHPSLDTPRMDAKTYQDLKHNYIQLLSTLFPNALSIDAAKEAPEKTDFGDIDIIIIDDGEVDWAKVAAELGVVAWVNRGTDTKPACSLAVHLDGTPSESPPIRYVLATENDPLQQRVSSVVDDKPYAQIDLVRIPSALQDWTVLYSSYGDLAGILGMVVTNFGFDVTETGLRLRLQEWDDSSLEEWQHFKPRKDEGKMILSTNRKETMEFFGMNVERYEDGFQTKEELFQWMSECRLISRYSLKRERNVPISREEKHAERKMFNEFFKKWLPEHLEKQGSTIPPSESEEEDDQQRRSAISKTRERWLDTALGTFKKRGEYNELHQNLLFKRGLETAEARLRPIVARHSRKSGKALAELMRAFRRNVEFRDGQPCILEQGLQDAESLLPTFLDETGRELQDSQAVEAWVKVNFDTVKDVERSRKAKRSEGAAGLD